MSAMSIGNRLALALALLGTSAGAAAAQFNCGDTIDAGQTVVLTEDVEGCTAATNPALTITGPAKVDMAGFRVRCDEFDPNDPNSPVGILLDGKGIKLSNGGVFGCGRSMVLTGDGGHKVDNFAAENAGSDGIVIESDKNKLKNVTSNEHEERGLHVTGDKNKFENLGVASNENDGMHVTGDKNQVKRAVFSENEGDGLELLGSRNKIKDCFASGNENESIDVAGNENKVEKCIVTRTNHEFEDPNDPGIEVDGDRNQIKNNLLNDNGTIGILVQPGADDNKITNNVAIGNVNDDLRDANATCGTNQWKKNTFGTSSADGAADPACIE